MRRNKVKEAYRLCLLAMADREEFLGFAPYKVDENKEPTYADFALSHNFECDQKLKQHLSELASLLKEDLGFSVACAVEDEV